MDKPNSSPPSSTTKKPLSFSGEAPDVLCRSGTANLNQSDSGASSVLSGDGDYSIMNMTARGTTNLCRTQNNIHGDGQLQLKLLSTILNRNEPLSQDAIDKIIEICNQEDSPSIINEDSKSDPGNHDFDTKSSHLTAVSAVSCSSFKNGQPSSETINSSPPSTPTTHSLPLQSTTSANQFGSIMTTATTSLPLEPLSAERPFGSTTSSSTKSINELRSSLLRDVEKSVYSPHSQNSSVGRN